MNAYIVVTNSGFWGKGTTPEIAATKAIEAGARRTDSGSLKVILGADPKDTKFTGAYFEYPSGATAVDAIVLHNIGALVPKPKK